MKSIMAVFVALVVLGVASIAAAALVPKKIGYEQNGDWTFSTDLSFDGGCVEPGTYCLEYYAPLRVCDADGVYARADTPSALYYFNAYYSPDDGDNWITQVDYDGCYWLSGVWPNPGYYICRGQEQEGYNNWDAPGTNHHVRYMAFNFKLNSEQNMQRFEFLFGSCSWLE